MFKPVENPLERKTYDGWLEADNIHVLVMLLPGGDSGTIAGYTVLRLEKTPNIRVLKSRTSVYISDFGLDRAYRGQGFGTRLMKEIVSLAKHWEADDIELSVSEFNTAAIRFYERLGFGTKTRRMELPLRSEGR